MTPIAPSLSFLCNPLCAVLSTILLQHVQIHSSSVDNPDSNSDCLLAQHSLLLKSGSIFAESQSSMILSALNFLRNSEVLESGRNSKLIRPHLSRVVSSVFAQFLAVCQKPSDFEKHIYLVTRSLDICAQSFFGQSSKVVDTTIKIDGTAFSFTNDEIEASSILVENITSSSSPGSTRFLLSSDWESNWTSEGQQGTHWICIQLKDGIVAKDVGICVQTEDNSWCPKVITCRAALTLDLLKAQPKAALDYSAQVSRGGRHFLKALDDNTGMPTLPLVNCCGSM